MPKALFEWFGLGAVAVLAAVTTTSQVSLPQVTIYVAAALAFALVAWLSWRTGIRRWTGQELRTLSSGTVGGRLVLRDGEAPQTLDASPQGAWKDPGSGTARPTGAKAPDREPGDATARLAAEARDRGPPEALTLIRSRMDEVSYTPGTPNVLAMTKYRHGDEAPGNREPPAHVPEGDAAELAWSRRQDGAVTFLEVAGVLDAVGAFELREQVDALAAERPSAVVVDLRSLRMIDSTGVGVIVRLYKRCTAAGGTVQVVGLSEQPLAVFRLLRLDRIFPLQ